MNPIENNSNLTSGDSEPDEKKDFPGYPPYPANEDLYHKFKEETNINPENISELKENLEIEKEGSWNEKDFSEVRSGDDLDIPGAELDDAEENDGSEDEENNYYSIGGDNHENLDENNDKS